MGTVGYMAPEQVRGAEADHRADIFALGVTLYEMLCGQRAFTGESAVETLNAILTSEPAEFETLGVSVPAEAARVVTHCLEKNAADRFQSARDLAFHLAGAAGSAGDARRTATPLDAVSRKPRRAWALPVGLVAAALVGALVTGGALRSSRTEAAPDTTAFTISSDLSGRPAPQGMSLSPDGRTLAVTWTAADGTGQLLLRSFDDKAPRLVVGTGSPQVPFFSPDGQHVAYASGTSQQLMRVPVAGGPAVATTALPGTRFGGVWLPDERIIYASSVSSDLRAVPAAGGDSEVAVPATAFDGASLRFPTASADGQVLVFQVGTRPPFRLGAYSFATGQAQIPCPGSSPRFAADGLVVYAFDGELWAAAFDGSRLQPATGRRLGVSVEVNSGGLATFAAVGDTLSSLAAGSTLRQLVIYDRAGQRHVLTEEPRRFMNNAVPSPDGTLIATSLNEATGSSVVVFDTVRNRLSPTNTPMSLSNVEWAPSGALLAFELGTSALRLIVPGAEVSGPPLITGVAATGSFAVTPQGDVVFLSALGVDAQSVFRAPLGDPSKAVRLWTPATGGISMAIRPSPDGRAVATSELAGSRAETFVRSLDDPERRVQVSVDGGQVVGWDQTGREVYYYSGGAVWSTTVTVRPTLAAGRPSRLFAIAGDIAGEVLVPRLRVMPDGQRFLAIEGPPSSGAQVLVVRHGLQRLLAAAAK